VSAADTSRPHSAFSITIDVRAFVYHASSQRQIAEFDGLITDSQYSYHRHNASDPIIPNGLAVIPTAELDDILQIRQ
jgi:hypothetical protein